MCPSFFSFQIWSPKSFEPSIVAEVNILVVRHIRVKCHTEVKRCVKQSIKNTTNASFALELFCGLEDSIILLFMFLYAKSVKELTDTNAS